MSWTQSIFSADQRATKIALKLAVSALAFQLILAGRPAGAQTGAFQVDDINATTTTSSSNPKNLVVVGDTLYFRATTQTMGTELWKSDGTLEGTVPVMDIWPGASSSSFGVPTNVNGRLFFDADDGVHGQALWTTDGTSAGTVMVKNITPVDGSLPKYPLIYMHGRNSFSFSKQEVDRLRLQIDRGAMLFADSCCASPQFDKSFRDGQVSRSQHGSHQWADRNSMDNDISNQLRSVFRPLLANRVPEGKSGLRRDVKCLPHG